MNVFFFLPFTSVTLIVLSSSFTKVIGETKSKFEDRKNALLNIKKFGKVRKN